MINEILGPSVYLLVLELFLNSPKDQMNLREIARRTGKNPGTISRVMPRLVERGFVSRDKIGMVTHAYRLNAENRITALLLDFRSKLENI